ncbi:MAG TPA: hypothetical protein VKT73_14800, partial [Xanthobacteraceae bacterium]|nr:hypothetical protein [Xanthobacteraceae bacterium]
MQHLSTILRCGNCGLENRLSPILNSRSTGTLLGTLLSIMSRFSRIAITIPAVAMAITITASGALCQTS